MLKSGINGAKAQKCEILNFPMTRLEITVKYKVVAVKLYPKVPLPPSPCLL
jgi:hypothetical protein